MNIIEQLEQEELTRLSAGKTIPSFGPGDTVIVSVNVVEGSLSDPYTHARWLFPPR